MKIAMICTEKLPVPPIAGGAVQIYLEGIVSYLSAEHDITVFSIQHPGLPEIETKNRVKYVRVPAGTETVYINSLKSSVDNSFDLIHVFNRPRYILELMDKLPDKRFSLSLHNEMFRPEKITDADALKCISKVEFINTVSKYIADTVRTRFPYADNKLHVVYSGVDTNQYKPVWSHDGIMNKNNMKQKYGLQGYKVVLFVGRLSVKKGVDVLLKAMERVMRSNPKTALVIVGSKWYGKNASDNYTKSLQTLSRSLAGPIIFTGFIPPADIPAYFNMGDVFVCASQWNEPLARVHYEAMAAGLPIITTNRGGNAEVVSGYGNGIVIDDYTNPAAIAGQISSLLNNEAEAHRMGVVGRRLAEQMFSWSRVAKEVIRKLEPVGQAAEQPAPKTTSIAAAPAAVNANEFQAGKPVGGSMNVISGGSKYAISGGSKYAISGGSMNAISGGSMNAISGGSTNAISGGSMNAISGAVANDRVPCTDASPGYSSKPAKITRFGNGKRLGIEAS